MQDKTIVLGGGITGLVSAYLMARSGKEVKIVEAGERVGGLLNTFEIGGEQLEFFYHHFFTHDAELNWLLVELDLSDQVIYKKTTMGVFRDKKHYPFNTPIDLLKFRPISWIGKVRFVLSTLFMTKVAKWRDYENVSAYSWFRKWAGKSSTEALWGPMLSVKFGPFYDKVPLSWMIGRMRQRMNSRKQGDERLGYLKGSLKVLCDRLVERLTEMGVEIVTSSPVTEIVTAENRVKSIKTAESEIAVDQLLVTIPTIYLKDLIKGNKLASQLQGLEYFGVYCGVLSLKKPLSQTYWLNVADPGFSFGGVIEHTNLIPASDYQGNNIVYLSRYFAQSEKLSQMSEQEVKELMLSDLKKIYPSLDNSDINDFKLFRSNTAAMVNDLNFSNKVPDCQTEIEGLFICNMAHIYPDERSVNNSIRIASEAVACMGVNSSFVPKNLSLSGKIGFLNT